ncbi:MAG: hypothetical protein ACM4AI_18270 [Acidobacteriota bacterium]
MVDRGSGPTPSAQFRPLTETFLARFFENEVTSGRTDLRTSFFWVVAVLAGPGLLGVVYRQFAWTEITMRHGSEALAAYVLFDKSLYLVITFVAIGFVSAVAWPSLSLDRRDGLILGALPIRLRVIVAAKLVAVGVYILVLSAGMHGLTALLVGGALGAGISLDMVGRGIAAHLIASSALGLFVFAAAAGVQATALALLGPRQFARISAVLQVLFVGIATAALIALPPISAAAPATLAGLGRAVPTPWILYTPPIWFLGLYETVAGSELAIMHDLAGTAMFALALSLLVTVAAYPIACRRVLLATVQGGAAGATPWVRSAMAKLPAFLARNLPTRAAIQFALSTFSRVSRQRLIVSAAIGVGVTAVTPIALAWLSQGSGPPSRRLMTALATLPVLLIVCLVTALRVAAAAPAELPARWVFAVAPAPPLAGREALRRIMIALGSMPIVVLSGAVWWIYWGGALAGGHVVVTLLASLTLIEIHLWGVAAIPCTRLLSPGSANIQARWPAYVVGLVLFCVVLPQAEVTLAGTEWGLFVMIALLGLLYIVIRRASIAAAVVAARSEDTGSLLLLDLSMPPSRGFK